MNTKILNLTDIENTTLTNINERIIDYILENDDTPELIILTPRQMSELTNLFVDGKNIGWRHYRGIPVILMKK